MDVQASNRHDDYCDPCHKCKLRMMEQGACDRCAAEDTFHPICQDCQENDSTEIMNLRAENAKLRGLVSELVDLASMVGCTEYCIMYSGKCPRCELIAKARAALKTEGEK